MNKLTPIVFFILLLLILSFIFFSQSPQILLAQKLINEALRPFESSISIVRNNLMFWQSVILNLKNIKKMNEALIDENLELYGKLEKLSELQKENRILREQLNLSKQNIIVKSAGSIGRDFQSNRAFLINKGSNDGIRNNMIVVAQGGMLIGKIIDTSYNTAKVRTILDTQSRIAAITADSNISGLARGLGSDIIFDLIAKNRVPETGELIIASGADGLWRRNLIIGKVKEVKSDDSQVFNTAGIQMLVNFQELTDVFVIDQ